MWTGSLYQFVLPPAEKGEAIIIIGIRRRTREIRESPLSSCQGLPHRVYVCDSSAGLLYTRVYARRPSFLYFPNWIALSAFRSLTLSSSHQGPTDSPAVPMSHTPARLRTSFTLTPRRSSPGGSRKNCIHTRAIR
jgi:hypothetical protein